MELVRLCAADHLGILGEAPVPARAPELDPGATHSTPRPLPPLELRTSNSAPAELPSSKKSPPSSMSPVSESLSVTPRVPPINEAPVARNVPSTSRVFPGTFLLIPTLWELFTKVATYCVMAPPGVPVFPT